MMVTALLLRPWIEQMKSVAAEPRVLADDLQILTTGPRHLENYVHASDLTHAHLHDMGAKLAAHKSISFSSEGLARKWLKQHNCRRLGCKIPVITDAIDLGAHFDATKGRMRGTTLTKRMISAARATDRLGRMKAPYEKKTKVIRAKMLP